jgi:mannose-6-phosphate isomerase
MGGPRLLTPSPREKIWGTPETGPWFPATGRRIGEVWFLSEGESLPILVKFIFTSEKLSVQVHPDDVYGRAHENSPGKTEMWHVLRAEPGATIAAGLKHEVSREALREAANSGEIENLLHWIPVQPGDTIFVPARTIHAIGAGIVLCEIQQQSDVTYRIYDYGRPRELHLEKGLAVASLGTHPGMSVPSVLPDGALRLASCPYFVTDVIELTSPGRVSQAGGGPQIVIVLEGSGRLGARAYETGQAWLIPAGAENLPVQPSVDSRLLRTYVP